MHPEVIVMFFIVCGFASIILLHMMNSHKRKIKTHDLLEKSIDKGIDVTPELLDKLNHEKSPRFKDFRRGIIMVALSVAAFCFSFIVPDDEAKQVFRGLSVFPFFIGAGFLLVWKLNNYED